MGIPIPLSFCRGCMSAQHSPSTEVEMEKSGRTSGDNITCPKCGEMIPITETIQQQLTEQTRAEMKREMAAEQKALAAREKDLQAAEARVAEARLNIDEQVA